MADAFYHRYYRGIMLPTIAHSLGVPYIHQKEACSRLHDCFREYLCVSSTSGFDNHTFLTYMSAILMLMAREKGILVPFFNETDDIQDMSMKDFINLQKIIDK